MLGITSSEAPSIRCQRAIDVLQEVEIFRRMDGGDRSEAVIARAARSRSRRRGACEQALDALRLFRVGLRRAARQEQPSDRGASALRRRRSSCSSLGPRLVLRGKRFEGLAIGQRGCARRADQAMPDPLVEVLRGDIVRVSTDRRR